MWHDTIRFVRCARQAFELPTPIHEYGLAAAGVPIVASEHPGSPELPEPGLSADRAPRIQSLDDLANLPCQDGCAGTVACLNILQHVAEPRAVAEEMIRLLAPGGLLLVCSCTAGRPSTNVNLLWRPAPHAFQKLLASLEASLIAWQGREGDPHSIYAVGCKAPVTPQYLAGANRFLKTFRQTLAREQHAVPWFMKAQEWLARVTGRSTNGRARKDYHRTQFVMHAPVDGQFQHDMLADCLHLDKTGTRLDFTQ